MSVSRKNDVPVRSSPDYSHIISMLKSGELEISEYMRLKDVIKEHWENNRYRICSMCDKKLNRSSFVGESKYCKKCKDKKKVLSKKKRAESTKRYLSSEKGKAYKRNKDRNYRFKKRANSDGSIGVVSLRKMLEDQDYKCNYCSVDISSSDDRHLDHIYPISKGGDHKIGNVQFLCVSCNIKKSNKII